VVEQPAVAQRAQDQLVQQRAVARRERLHVGAGQPLGEQRAAALGVAQDLEGETSGGRDHDETQPSRAPGVR
jgi:hypothetical protein